MTKLELYITYRKIQSEKLSKGYMIPKDFDVWFNKQKKEIKDGITNLTGFFNTKFHNINSELYIRCGFEIWKNFTYHQFTDEKVIKLYKIRDKSIKREGEAFKKSYVESIKYILKIIRCKECSNISDYFDKYSKMDNGIKPIQDFLKNKICKYMIVYLILNEYLVIDDFDKNYLSIIKNNYGDYVKEIKSNKTFICKLFQKVNDKLLEINNINIR